MKKCMLLEKKIIPGDYEALWWVCKAVSKEPSRYKINKVRISVEEKTATATDGHRLHEHSLMGENLETGLYSVYLLAKKLFLIQESDSIDEYPKYQKILSDLPDKSLKQRELHPGKGFISQPLSGFMKMIDEQDGVDIRYFTEMMSIGSWKVSYFGTTQPILFSEKGRRGLLMPMRLCG